MQMTGFASCCGATILSGLSGATKASIAAMIEPYVTQRGLATCIMAMATEAQGTNVSQALLDNGFRPFTKYTNPVHNNQTTITGYVLVTNKSESLAPPEPVKKPRAKRVVLGAPLVKARRAKAGAA